MQKNIYYHIILDKSGSMQDCIHPTITGYNEQLQVIQSLQHRNPELEIRVGLTQFNNEVEQCYYAQPPINVGFINQKQYVPSGMTALLDAIGTTVLKIRDDLAEELAHGDSTVIIVILTDGYENASRLFNQQGIKNLIRELEATGKWTFTYLGATIDAVQVAEQLNIKKENSMAFDKSQMFNSFKIVTNSLEGYVEHRKKGANLGNFLKKDGK
jgi:uncharacterized protein YegL